MNDWERQICARVKIARESLRWSQPDFAALLEITRAQLAAIESGNTPLRYDIAWRLRQAVRISMRWLDAEDAFADDFEDDELPHPNETGLPKRALLSTICRRFPRSTPRREPGEPEGAGAPIPRPPLSDAERRDAHRRLFVTHVLQSWVENWTYLAPFGQADKLSEVLSARAYEFLKSFPEEPMEVLNRRGEEMMWERIRQQKAHEQIDIKSAENNPLQDLGNALQSPSMKRQSLWKALRERLTALLSRFGAKAALAREFGVTPASVSEWLSGDSSPTAETTLRLLQWVTAKEAHQNESSDRAITRPEPKTQLRQSSYEKPKSGHKTK